jgi:hypothetical protein
MGECTTHRRDGHVQKLHTKYITVVEQQFQNNALFRVVRQASTDVVKSSDHHVS